MAMETLRAKALCDESGAAVIELVFVMPLLVLIMAAVLDLGSYIKLNMAIDSAATAAVRYCMDNPENADNPDSLGAYLQSIDPDIAGTRINIVTDDVMREGYTHLFYVDETDNVISRQSYCSYQPFSIELAYQTSFKTLVGKSISIATGGNGLLVAATKKGGVMDRTDGDTW